ncbi:MAG TPA: hypothetical protein VEK08_27000 [Planctomycetota bacterium]|nr:hypothetical protein [Planctomycetota bacterium]
MANFVITPNGGSAITFAQMTDGCTAVVNKYWITRPRPRTPVYGLHTGKGSGVSGLWVKRNNFGGRIIDNIEVLYVQASEALCISAFEADLAAMMNVIGGNVLSIPDFTSTFKACECQVFEPLMDGKGRIIKPTHQGGTYRLRAVMQFYQMRTTA